MSWRAGFCAEYQGATVRFAFTHPGRLWWVLEDLCVVFRVAESPGIVFLDVASEDRAELAPYHVQVVNSAALGPWVEATALEQFHAWIRHWLFPVLQVAFAPGIRDAAEAMAVLHQQGVTFWRREDDDSLS